jgi:hypothetical protein
MMQGNTRHLVDSKLRRETKKPTLQKVVYRIGSGNTILEYQSLQLRSRGTDDVRRSDDMRFRGGSLKG